MNKMPLTRLFAVALIAALAACGGGGGGGGGGGDSLASAPTGAGDSGGSGGGIGGTGLSSSGTIDGFGSIFVNGIEFETESAEIVVDGEISGEDA